MSDTGIFWIISNLVYEIKSRRKYGSLVVSDSIDYQYLGNIRKIKTCKDLSLCEVYEL